MICPADTHRAAARDIRPSRPPCHALHLRLAIAHKPVAPPPCCLEWRQHATHQPFASAWVRASTWPWAAASSVWASEVCHPLPKARPRKPPSGWRFRCPSPASQTAADADKGPTCRRICPAGIYAHSRAGFVIRVFSRPSASNRRAPEPGKYQDGSDQRAGPGAADSAQRTERIERASPCRWSRSIPSRPSIPRQMARAASVSASLSGWLWCGTHGAMDVPQGRTGIE